MAERVKAISKIKFHEFFSRDWKSVGISLQNPMDMFCRGNIDIDKKNY